MRNTNKFIRDQYRRDIYSRATAYREVVYSLIGLVVVLLIVGGSCSDVANAYEADYVKSHCKGIVEHVLSDRTRVDCLTDMHAIEYDYGKKWAEAIGQSLHYSMHTGRRAGIVLISQDASDAYGVFRADMLIRHFGLPIDMWVIK